MENNKLAWEQIFFKKGKFFENAHPDIDDIVKIFNKHNVKKVLDFGSGTGRHVVYLSKLGFDLTGIDISKTGIKICKEWLKHEKLEAKLICRDIFKTIPYPNGYFDAVISTQVIHHGKRSQIEKTIQEISRVVRPGGVMFITVPPDKKFDPNKKGWKMKEIDKRTFLPLDGPEKGLVHYFFTKDELNNSFSGFNILKNYLDRTNHLAIIGVKK